MLTEPLTVDAIFENGLFRPVQPLTLQPQKRVRLTIECQEAQTDWPVDVAAIYEEIAEEDRRLVEMMHVTVRETWPASEGKP